MNRVSLVGRITAKPELRYTSSNIPFTRFSLAVNRTFTNSQGEREADFISITVWRKQAENVCNYLDKGSLISVDGRIQTGSYDDNDGNRRYTFDVVSDNVQFLESRSQSQNRSRETVEQNNVNPYSFQDINDSNDIYSSMGDSISLDDADID